MAPTITTNSAVQSPPKILSVLVIDDNPADQELAKIYLGKAWPFESDMAVETALDGIEALEKLRRQRFCLIILDWRLPRGGSGHVLYEIRRQGVFIPVVVVTGSERDQLPADLESAGSAYVNKNDLNVSTLYCAIAEALRNCRKSRQRVTVPATGHGPTLFHSHGPQAVCG